GACPGSRDPRWKSRSARKCLARAASRARGSLRLRRRCRPSPGSLGLQVPHVDRGRSAGEPDHDHAGGLLPCCGYRGLQAQQVSEAQPEQAGRVELEKITAMIALAVGAEYRCHANTSFLPLRPLRREGIHLTAEDAEVRRGKPEIQQNSSSRYLDTVPND